ncbi:Putative oxidoreductase [gamma proteobacterium IMCC2047]|nr:Putative oxidoreductase [gamma proteobacterium IMCC2047]
MYDYTAPANLLKDRIILVTGAGDGIGKAAAMSYAKHGATVILVGRGRKKLDAVYDEIEANGWPQPVIVSLNLADATAENFKELANMIGAEFGRLDGVLHNASTLGKRTPLASYDDETWQEVMHLNVTSPFMLTKALLPLVEEADNGSIVFTSSSVGRKGRAFWGAYAISKAATENMMETLADEQDGVTNIRVNCINPGATRTNMRMKAYPGEDPDKLATPEQIMPLYLYLMGDDSIAMNGKSFDAQ